MKIEHIEKGKKAHFDSIEDILQTFFVIGRALYQVAKVENKTIRIRVDFPEGDDDE